MFFKNIVGQTPIKNKLIRSIKDGFIPNAWLIVGNHGAGTLVLALAYARYLHCSNKGENDACGKCLSCLKFNKLTHPDLHFIFPIVNKKEDKKESYCDDFLPEWRNFLLKMPYGGFTSWSKNIKENKIQSLIYARESDEIIRKLSFKSYESYYKSVIIWLPEKMHKSTANKLLKLLEEPPIKTVFILVSEDTNNILKTICSRTQILIVPPITDQDLFCNLKKIYNVSEQNIWATIRLAEGDYEKATKILSSLNEDDFYFNLFTSVMYNAFQKNILNMKIASNEFAAISKERQKKFLEYAQKMIREIFFYRLHKPEINYMNNKETEFVKKNIHFINEVNIFDFTKEFILAKRHIEYNVNSRMIFFDLSMKIALFLKKH
ncbi:MAG: DNA polymerase III subunit delta [Bacteroidales bacterium OttesenSCG-928-I14]|jgi:DNA polymerase-3 subunit delta'|nr:DNA polymerase III subunit delta [Bacteroidales bacterium OttesenSCG-928-I14]